MDKKITGFMLSRTIFLWFFFVNTQNNYDAKNTTNIAYNNAQ